MRKLIFPSYIISLLLFISDISLEVDQKVFDRYLQNQPFLFRLCFPYYHNHRCTLCYPLQTMNYGCIHFHLSHCHNLLHQYPFILIRIVIKIFDRIFVRILILIYIFVTLCSHIVTLSAFESFQNEALGVGSQLHFILIGQLVGQQQFHSEASPIFNLVSTGTIALF